MTTGAMLDDDIDYFIAGDHQIPNYHARLGKLRDEKGSARLLFAGNPTTFLLRYEDLEKAVNAAYRGWPAIPQSQGSRTLGGMAHAPTFGKLLAMNELLARVAGGGWLVARGIEGKD